MYKNYKYSLPECILKALETDWNASTQLSWIRVDCDDIAAAKEGDESCAVHRMAGHHDQGHAANPLHPRQPAVRTDILLINLLRNNTLYFLFIEIFMLFLVDFEI